MTTARPICCALLTLALLSLVVRCGSAQQPVAPNWQTPQAPAQLPPESQEYLKLLQQPENARAGMSPAPNPASQPLKLPVVNETTTTAQPVQPATYQQSLPVAGAPAQLPLEKESAKPIPLAGPAQTKPKTTSSWANLGTMLLSLGVVLLLFLATMWLLRKTMPGTKNQLGRGVVELLGTTPMGQRQSLQVIRFGNKILLVAMGPSGCDTLTEITDPFEVDRLAGLCQQQQANSISGNFRDLFRQITSIRSGERQADEEDTAEPTANTNADPAIEAVRARLRAGSLSSVSLTTKEVTRG
jgi:flagellar biogenesis protein FliO